MKLTLALCTARMNAGFDLMAESVHSALNFLKIDLQVLIVDNMLAYFPERAEMLSKIVCGRFPYLHIQPKRSIWNGPHRLTKNQYADIASTKNSALIAASGDYIVFMDDATAIAPGCLPYHMHAAQMGFNLAGCVENGHFLKLDHGFLSGYERTNGRDFLFKHISKCHGGWWFGGNGGVHMSHAIAVNGFDETCARVGGEDCDFGVRLVNAGYEVKVSPDCLMFEDAKVQFCEENKNPFMPLRRYTYDERNEQNEKFYAHQFWEIMDKDRATRTLPLKNDFNLAEAREVYKLTGQMPIYVPFEIDPITGIRVQEL